jgi:hypothetical protein
MGTQEYKLNSNAISTTVVWKEPHSRGGSCHRVIAGTDRALGSESRIPGCGAQQSTLLPEGSTAFSIEALHALFFKLCSMLKSSQFVTGSATVTAQGGKTLKITRLRKCADQLTGAAEECGRENTDFEVHTVGRHWRHRIDGVRTG